MLALKIIKWLLVAAVAGPVLSVVATCIGVLLLVLVLLPGGLEILLLGWARARGWLASLLPCGVRAGA
jgi:hypothetical protein